jgi:23S rRNA pseudouridine2605 synthase
MERLQKLIARAGIASRRHAEQLILSGQVLVNGKVVTELGTKADPTKDRIEAAGRLIQAEERRVYLLLHKPPEVVSSLADPEGRRTLRNLLRGFPERVYPVGNLEYSASGLVFLTNDGDLAAKLLKRWDEVDQIYHVKIKGMLVLADLDRIGKDTRTRVKTLRQPDSSRGHAQNYWYEATIRGPRLEKLRNALFDEHHPVEKVKRIGLGTLSLEGIPPGRYKPITAHDAAALLSAKPAKVHHAKKTLRKSPQR